MSTLAKDPEYWVQNPGKTSPGIRIRERDGTAYLEEVYPDGEVEILACLLRDQLPAVIDGLQRVLNGS